MIHYVTILIDKFLLFNNDCTVYYLYNRESVASYNGGNTKVEYDSYSMVVNASILLRNSTFNVNYYVRQK